MAIISEHEEFLLKFRQESSNENYKSIEVSVTKSNGSYVLDMKQDKKGFSIKIELDSLIEIINYVQSKVQTSKNEISKPSVLSDIKTNEKTKTSVSATYGNYNDLVKDLDVSVSNESSKYNSQAEVIIGNGVNLSMLGKF
jgi:hypothetical protein